MPTPLLLDTQCWIWLHCGMENEFSRSTLREIERACQRDQCWVSVLSVWELGMIIEKGKMRIKAPAAEFVRLAFSVPGYKLVPLPPEAALEASRLPGALHGDPVDRMLAATARHFRIPLVTADQKLIEYGRQGHCQILPCSA